jgi:hypothetical protein
MKRTSLLAAVLALSSTFATAAAAAQPAPHTGSAWRGPVAAAPVVHPASGVRERREARWDVRQVEALRQRLVAARRSGHRAALRDVDADLQRYLTAELRETRGEVAEARGEVREERRENAWGRGRDGRQDVREARGEARREARELARLRAIDGELERLYGRFDRGALQRKEALVSELVQLARREVRS